MKRLEVVVDLHTVIKGWRKMAVDTRSDDKLGQSWKKGFFPMTKGIFKFTRKCFHIFTSKMSILFQTKLVGFLCLSLGGG